MAAVDYFPFIDRVISRYEGGYCWDQGDPGGPTNFGITCYDLAEHRGQKMTSMSAWVDPVRHMTRAEAETIYKAKYAAGVRFDDLPVGVDVVLLDYAINSGVSRAVLVARAMCGLQPGGMDATVVNLLGHVDPKDFIEKTDAERVRFMHAIDGGKAWARFGHGWGSRVADLTQYAEALTLRTTPIAAPDLTHVVTPKAVHTPKTATGATAGGVVASTAAAHTAGFPWHTVAAIGIAVATAGVLYEVYHDLKAKAANATVHI
jgi:lysozyme family protein